ncbi:MAG: RNA polymerase sigma factor [Alistipes sp.]|nr:RNA polymerase sigma factor [Alistipes sp.]
MVTETEYISLVERLKDTVFRLARSILSDIHLAEDVTQDVFVRVWQQREAIVRSDHPRAYICRIAHNLAIDRLRHRERERSFAIEEVAITSRNYDDAERSDMVMLTKRFISELPERQRIVIHLRDVEGYELEDIAQILEADEASVRVNLSRARKSIKEQLLNAMNYGVE